MNYKDILENYKSYTVEQLENALAFSKSQEKLYNTRQLAQKVNINGGYGALGNEFFPHYRMENAEAITTTGQYIIKMSSRYLNEYIWKLLDDKEKKNRVVYMDTDSSYIEAIDIVKRFIPNGTRKEKVDFLDKFCKKVEEDVLAPLYKNIFTSFNCFEQKMHMDREVIAVGDDGLFCGFWLAKKKYAILMDDKEGIRYDNRKMKIMGLACVQSSTPEVCRKDIENVIRIMLDSGESAARKAIKEIRERFFSLSPEEVAFAKGVSSVDGNRLNMQSWIPKKNCPIGSKAAINHNNLVTSLKLDHIPLIMDGSKIQFLYLQDPNPMGRGVNYNVIGFVETLPKEFDLAQYVDYSKQFEAAFLKPIRDYMNCLEYSIDSVVRIPFD